MLKSNNYFQQLQDSTAQSFYSPQCFLEKGSEDVVFFLEVGGRGNQTQTLKQNQPSFLLKTDGKESKVCYKKVAYTAGAEGDLYRSTGCALVRDSSLLRHLQDKCYPQISV